MSAGSVRLSENFVRVSEWFPLTKEALARLKLRALRRGVWFRELKVSERQMMDLVIRIVDKVRSRVLAKVLSHIVNKLLEAMGNIPDVMEAVVGRVAYWMMKNGRCLAQELSRIANDWGNKSAYSWPADRGFIQYLTVMDLNKP